MIKIANMPAAVKATGCQCNDEANGESDPSTWDDWVDDWRWELNPFHDVATAPADEPTQADWDEVAEMVDASAAKRYLDQGERLTLSELVERQVDFYRAWGNPVGEMLSRAMETLAFKIRLTSSTTPAEFEAREESLEQTARDTWEAAGYEAARAEFLNRPPAGAAWGHDAA